MALQPIEIQMKRLKLFSRAFGAIRSGRTLTDKLTIMLMVARVLLFPLARLRRFGISVPDPARLVQSYSFLSDGLIVTSPGSAGPYFLFADSTQDHGVRSAIAALESGTFIDVGAHVGYFSLLAGKRLGGNGHVLSIEPHPVRCAFLRQNITMNALGNVTCVECAAGDVDGAITLFDLDPQLGPHDRDVSYLSSEGRRFEVAMRSIDSLCQEHHIDSAALVKIDVEGFEPRVILGMHSLIRRSRPIVVFEALDRASLDESSSLLTDNGYAIVQVDDINYLARPRSS